MINREQLYQIIIPSVFQVVISIAIAALILAAAFSSLPYHLLLQAAQVHSNETHTVYQHYLSYLDSLTVIRLAGIGLFWLAAALLAYAGGLMLLKFLVVTRNEIVTQTEFVGHPPLAWRIKFLIAQIAVAVGFLVVLVISVTLLFPLWLNLFQGFVGSPSTLGGVAELVGSLGGLTVNIYIIWTAWQIVLLID